MKQRKKRIQVVDGRTEADLRRPTSDLFYALFHRVCEALVEPIGANPESPAFIETYRVLYRIPEHTFLEKRCRDIKSHSFCEEIETFSHQIVVMRNKREAADYDPLQKFAISVVENDVQAVSAALSGFEIADPVEKNRFAYFVSLKGRKLD